MLPSTFERFDVKNHRNIFNNYSTSARWIRDGTCLVGYNDLISNKRKWNNYFFKIKTLKRIALFELPNGFVDAYGLR